MVQGLRICLSMQEVQEIWVRSLGQEDPLEKEMATHSSILACEIPRTEEPDGLQSMGSQRVRHNSTDICYQKICMRVSVCAHTFM